MIWPSDLVFDSTIKMFKPELEIIKKNILIDFEKDWAKSVAFGVWTRFLFDLGPLKQYLFKKSYNRTYTKKTQSRSAKKRNAYFKTLSFTYTTRFGNKQLYCFYRIVLVVLVLNQLFLYQKVILIVLPWFVSFKRSYESKKHVRFWG